MRLGRRLAIDVGTVRVGLAISDAHGILASPLQNLKRSDDLSADVAALSHLLADYELLEIYVGLPVAMSGHTTKSTKDAVAFARAVSAYRSEPVRLIDERLTSVSANAILRNAGHDGKRSRQVVDQVAATLILEQAMNQEKSSGTPPGVSLDDYSD